MVIGYSDGNAIVNACPVFEAALRRLSPAYGRGAYANARRAAALGPLVLALDYSLSDDAGAERRGFAIADLARRWAARAFDAAGLPVQAAELRNCAGITDARTAEAAEAVAAAVANAVEDEAEPALEAAGLAASAAAWAARCALGVPAGHAVQSAREAAEYAGGAAIQAVEAVEYAAHSANKSARIDLDTLDLCVSELLDLVKRETARGA